VHRRERDVEGVAVGPAEVAQIDILCTSALLEALDVQLRLRLASQRLRICRQQRRGRECGHDE